MRNSTSDPVCPLCSDRETQFFHRDRKREYLQCQNCHLVFVPTQFHLSPCDEKAEYDKHQNALDDPGYRRFLQRLSDPLMPHLKSRDCGLDFGCGPAPALAELLREAGFTVSLYDTFYQPDSSVLHRRYDFITASEVVEHLAQPGQQLDRLWQLLRPGGTLGLMTKRVIDRERFISWHYIRDPTHIAFFSDKSFRWLATHLGAELNLPGPDVALLHKPASAADKD